jgi:hypothetical protein
MMAAWMLLYIDVGGKASSMRLSQARLLSRTSAVPQPCLNRTGMRSRGVGTVWKLAPTSRPLGSIEKRFRFTS